MHFHLPKPLHGWREFAGEVGIIVVGVLIALAAEQVVETMRWKAEVADARKSLDAQLALSKSTAIERLKREACIDRELDWLQDVIDSPGRRRVVKVRLAPIRLWSTSGWESATASGAVAHMKPEVRDRYATLFSFTDALRDMNWKEYELQASVRLLERNRPLTPTAVDRLSDDISRLRSLNFILSIGARQWLDEARPLHLAITPEDVADLKRAEICLMPDQQPPKAA